MLSATLSNLTSSLPIRRTRPTTIVVGPERSPFKTAFLGAGNRGRGVWRVWNRAKQGWWCVGYCIRIVHLRLTSFSLADPSLYNPSSESTSWKGNQEKCIPSVVERIEDDHFPLSLCPSSNDIMISLFFPPSGNPPNRRTGQKLLHVISLRCLFAF